MKIRYFKSGEARKARRAAKALEQRVEYKERVAKWHSKFVIWPRQIETPGEESCFATKVFFEKIWQKARIVNNIGPASYDETVWTRHREKEYFIKKLDGTLEAEEQFGNEDMQAMSSGATSGPVSGFSSASAVGTSSRGMGSVTSRKLGGPTSGNTNRI